MCHSEGSVALTTPKYVIMVEEYSPINEGQKNRFVATN